MMIIINNMWHFWCTRHYEHLEGRSLPTTEKKCTVIQSVKRTWYKNKYLWFSHSNLMQVSHCHFPPYTVLPQELLCFSENKKERNKWEPSFRWHPSPLYAICVRKQSKMPKLELLLINIPARTTWSACYSSYNDDKQCSFASLLNQLLAYHRA